MGSPRNLHVAHASCLRGRR